MPTPSRPPDLRPRAQAIKAVVTAATRVAASQLARDLGSDPSLMVSFATHAENIWQEIEAVRPDVVLLDTRIAGNGAPSLVNDLVQRAKLPVLIRTEIGENSPQMLIDCVEAGALGIVNKPASIAQAAETIPSLIWTLKSLAGASIANLLTLAQSNWPATAPGDGDALLAIGASLGGALPMSRLLTQLPAGCPGTVAIAPLPVQVISAWADRLTSRCKVRIKQAADGDLIRRGQVLIAPGEKHLVIRRQGTGLVVRISDGPSVFHQKPSIEVLLNSVADTVGSGAVGVLLGGAGVDGIAALLHLRKSGGQTLTESPESSIFPDSCKRSLDCGAAQHSDVSTQLASRLIELAATTRVSQAA